MSSFADSRSPQPQQDDNDVSLASLLSLLESVPALVWQTGPELYVTHLTGAALHKIQVSSASLVGRPVDELFASPSARQAHEAALRGQTGFFDLEVNGRDLHATVKPLPGPRGGVVGVAGMALDLTERMVAERALRLSEYSYRSLIEEAPYAICRATLGGELLQVNRAMLEMLGYDVASTAELLLRDLPLIFTPAGSFEPYRKALLAGEAKPGTDAAWLRRDGRSIEVRVTGRAVRDGGGHVSHLDILAENVTEKKQLEAELSHAQKMQAIGQLAGGVAHDFNNLLTVISGQVELMLGQSLQRDAHERLLEIKLAADKAASLTRQLLAFSRRQVLRSRIVNLNQVIHPLMGMLSRLIKESVELTFVAGDGLGNVKADPHEIERVLLNLALNAQDAMPGGGRLTIETANARIEEQASVQPDELKAGDYVQITVRDNGHGMDRDTQARVFEPFFTTKQPNEGTGLGLSVVYGVVRQSGGYIRLESEPGLGTTFRIFLPRVAPPAAPVPETSTGRAAPRGSETILFAEDDTAIRKLVAHSLRSLGYQVLSAPDGVDAIGMAESHDGPIHLLLSDLVMPTVGGRELAATLRRMSPGLKVLFISGYAGNSAAVKELDLPGVFFLQKPFSMEILARTIRGVLDGSLL
jgi:PAS domain S-box-containing protein